MHPKKRARIRIKEGEDNEYRSVAVNDEQQSRFLETCVTHCTRRRRIGQAISPVPVRSVSRKMQRGDRGQGATADATLRVRICLICLSSSPLMMNVRRDGFLVKPA